MARPTERSRGLAPTSASEIWGLVDADDNREYAILGHRTGTAIYDVTTPATPVLVGNIPGNPSLWREVKALQVRQPDGSHRAYAYVSTEAAAGRHAGFRAARGRPARPLGSAPRPR